MLKHLKLQILLIVVVSLSGILNSQTSPLGTNGLPLYQDGKIYLQIRVQSNVVIHKKDSISNDVGGVIQSLFLKYQVQRVERPFTGFNNTSLNKNYRITFDNVSKVDSFIIELSLITNEVEYAEKVPAYYVTTIPNDPLATQNGTYVPTFYHLSLLKANEASSIHTSTGSAIVAIVDDAVLTTHDDLFGNIGSVNTGSDVADQDNDPNPALTGTFTLAHGYLTHGTGVAGVAGAVTNNGIGISSIGWNNKLMCVKTTSSNISLSILTNAIDGIVWAALNGAKVINMSFGSPGPSITEYSAIILAKSLDVVLVASAGNDSQNTPIYPAAYGEGVSGIPGEIIDKRLVVAVSALDQNNNISIWGPGSGSNFGNWVDISAYGTSILTTKASASSTNAINNTYYSVNGTSYSAPMISGIAGIMRSYKPLKTANEIIDCILNTANTDIYGTGHPNNIIGTLGTGRADAEAALKCISTDCSITGAMAIIVPSSPSLCANTTLTLTTNSANSYTWSNGANTQSIVVSTPGTYSVGITYAGFAGCTATTSITFSTAPTLSLSVSVNTTICSGHSVNLVTASGNYSNLLWQPNGIITNSAVLNPTAYTIYTVIANAWCGGVTQTVGVSPISGAPPIFNAYSVMGGTLSGNYNPNFPTFDGHFLINSDAIINNSATFYHSEVLIAPNVKISVPSSSTLNINWSHLHTCGTQMWKGVELADASEINFRHQSMIEDAITAVSSTHTPVTTLGLLPAVISASYTVFNKNFVDISLTNYYDFLSNPSHYNSHLDLKQCLFSCRNYLAGWVVAGIGAAFTSSTGLSSPHTIPSSSITTLKAPYTNQTSHTAIKLNSVGVTTNNVYYGIQIGDATNASNFNLFDSHHKFIDATNSNVVLRNNVFQNCSGPAVESVFTATTSMKGVLDLSPSSATVTNRFWDCRQAISGNRVYKFNMRHAIVRSTQNATNTANSALCFGVNMKTGNFDYIISQNEFTNIYDGINISVIPVSINSGTFNFSYIDAHDLIITSNTISAGNVSGSFGNRAINVSSLFNIPWTIAPACNYTYTTHSGNISNHCRGLTIDGNHINGAFRGIAVNGVSNFQTNIQGNIISLRDDNVFNVAQQGIYLVNSMSGANKPSQFQIAQNSVSGGTASVSNPLMSMVFSGNNMGIYSPSISCNEIQDSHKGFVFNGANSNAVWAGNIMQPMAQGLRLENAAVIGTQGGPSLVNANQWQGTWTGDHTYVDGAATNATNSVLWVKSGAALNPTNNGGQITSQKYGTSNNSIMNGSVAADFNCIGIPNAIVIPVPNINDFNDDTQGEYYIQKTALYRFLHFNDSLRLADEGGELATFYSNMAETSIDKFMQVEELLYEGNYADAQDMLALIEPSDQHPVENNYKDFYTLCANYLTLDEDQQYSEADSLALHDLAILCPGTNGACIYQARALYNTIFGQEVNYEGCGEASGNRAANNTSIENIVETRGLDGIKIFPNPATNKLNIIGKNETDLLNIEIFDVSGRSVFQKTLLTKNKSFDLDFDLLNGIYFLTIKDSQNNTLNEKLIIAK